jgi:hypothetical protein
MYVRDKHVWPGFQSDGDMFGRLCFSFASHRRARIARYTNVGAKRAECACVCGTRGASAAEQQGTEEDEAEAPGFSAAFLRVLCLGSPIALIGDICARSCGTRFADVQKDEDSSSDATERLDRTSAHSAPSLPAFDSFSSLGVE